jgi:hypothetical protein
VAADESASVSVNGDASAPDDVNRSPFVAPAPAWAICPLCEGRKTVRVGEEQLVERCGMCKGEGMIAQQVTS